MSEDNRLKKTTRRAFGKKRRRPWNARRNSARHVPKSPLAGLNTEPHPSTSSVDASSGSIERIILTELPVDASNTEPQPTTSSVYASSTHAVSAGVESIRRSSVGCSSAKTQLGASSVDTSSAHVSSAVMERRSLQKHRLRYTTMLSDGDSRTFHALTEESVYGFVKVEKKDCINHVHKRRGAALRTLVDKKKAQGQPLGGKGRLTQDKIKKITNYYGYALRSHKNDVPGMKRAVEATLRHMSSTDDAPKHDLCPEGVQSWCSYNRAVAKGEKPPLHKNSLPDFVCDALQPVFKRLSEEALLDRCSDGMTQNASESSHSVIWDQNKKLKEKLLDMRELSQTLRADCDGYKNEVCAKMAELDSLKKVSSPGLELSARRRKNDDDEVLKTFEAARARAQNIRQSSRHANRAMKEDEEE
ncbi:hypothetical protein HPB52_021267 [Rhipicephalus sanguineus]|uniref:Mutator-like transposase domain-containing protein n=1 Tax=Rhipicephalus sanguineus TaxID=34632 RepID=A0A9D4Q2X7_RHISA|nr:hypothetical protein HPB52_021267 [Rhipicephalus sanguineus]